MPYRDVNERLVAPDWKSVLTYPAVNRYLLRKWRPRYLSRGKGASTRTASLPEKLAATPLRREGDSIPARAARCHFRPHSDGREAAVLSTLKDGPGGKG